MVRPGSLTRVIVALILIASGVIYGFLSVGNGIGGGVAPWFGGFVHDVTGSYRVAFLVATAFCVVGSACFWLARPPRRDR